jgi:hypothetical protein
MNEDADQVALSQYLDAMSSNNGSTELPIPVRTSVGSMIEHMALVIHECMSITARNYHGINHVFVVAQPFTSNPIAVLAALFHDTIYVHVDGGLSPQQTQILNISLSSSSSSYEATGLFQEDPILCLVEEVFGYAPGTAVTLQNGLNEFLSAVLAVRMLAPLLLLPPLGEQHCMIVLMQIVACIEATIPFRGIQANAVNPMQRLYQRLQQVYPRFGGGQDLDEATLEDWIVRAVEVANSDVENFGANDRQWFLDNTWSLLPETNESLRHSYLYTVAEYQFAVFKMYKFFHFLPAHAIFQQFTRSNGTQIPSPDTIKMLTAEAVRNLEVGRKYVSAKLLAMSVLSAFAQLTGGNDVPISLFMGDLPSRHRQSVQLSDQIPVTDLVPDHVDRDVYDMLAVGRRSESSFDVRQSPLAAYLYRELGDEALEKVLSTTPVYPMTRDVARTLLSLMPLAAVTLLGQLIANVALSRKQQIETLLEELAAADALKQ